MLAHLGGCKPVRKVFSYTLDTNWTFQCDPLYVLPLSFYHKLEKFIQNSYKIINSSYQCRNTDQIYLCFVFTLWLLIRSDCRPGRIDLAI